MKFFICIFILVVLIGCGRDTSHPPGAAVVDSLVLTDAYGKRVAIPQPVSRIVSLAPNLTEILFALGAEDRIIGVTRFCTFPAAAQSITKVGDLQTPDYERLVALHPDIVFMSFSGNLPEAYEKMHALGLRPYLTSSLTIEDVEVTIRTVAHIIGRDSTGKMLADTICNAVDSIRAESLRRTPIDAVMFLSVNPPIAVGNGFLDEALAVAGGRNVMHNETIAYPAINREALVARRPRVIIVPTDVPESADEIWSMFPEWNILRNSGTRIVRLNADPLLRPGPRIVEGIREMAGKMRE